MTTTTNNTLSDRQKQVAIDWWTGQITRNGVKPLTERQINSFRGCMLSLLNHHEQLGVRGCLWFIDRPSAPLAHCLAYPGMQVDEGGGRAEAIPWDNVPKDVQMLFNPDGHVWVFELGSATAHGDRLTPDDLTS